MQASVLEIVEMPDGDVVLRRSDDKGEELVRIHFSREANAYLPEGRLQVARVMIQAGIQAAAELAGAEAEFDYVTDSVDDERILH